MKKKETFSTTIREFPNRLPNPASYGFDPKVWHDAFKVLNDGSPDDQNLFLLGLVLGEQYQRVLDSVKHLASHVKFRNLEELAPYFSKRVNDVQRMAFESWGAALQQFDAVTQEQTREMRCFVDSAGNSHALQTPMEAVIDGICGVLKLLGRTNGLGTLPAGEIESVDIRNSIAYLMDLAQHSLSIQRVWSSVIWHRSNVRVDPQSGNYAIDETHSDLARRSTIDLTRRPAFLTRSFNRLDLEKLHASMGNVLIPKVFFENGCLAVRAVPAFTIPEEERKVLIDARNSYGLLQENALSDFISVEHPTVGLKISEMLVIWGELALIAHQLQEMAHSLDVKKDNVAMSIVLESRFQQDEIIEALRRCVVLPNDRFRECLNFFCFAPTKGATLWDHPILTSGAYICLLGWALMGVHHARLLSAWAKMDSSLKKSFEKKGSYNEKMMNEIMQSAISQSPYSAQIEYIGSNLHPRLKPDEEIDMLIVVDDVAFVIEIASIPSPAEAFEFYETEKRLEKKAEQCRMQCAILKRDLNQIDDWKHSATRNHPIKDIFGLVITNSYLRDGNYSDDVCYCHWETLINIINYGGMYFGLMRGNEEYTLKAPIWVPPGQPVVDSIISALKFSPKAEFYTSSLTRRDIYIKGFDNTDREGIYRTWDMEFPPPHELESCLRNCSFGSTLEEVENPLFD